MQWLTYESQQEKRIQILTKECSLPVFCNCKLKWFPNTSIPAIFALWTPLPAFFFAAGYMVSGRFCCAIYVQGIKYFFLTFKWLNQWILIPVTDNTQVICSLSPSIHCHVRITKGSCGLAYLEHSLQRVNLYSYLLITNYFLIWGLGNSIYTKTYAGPSTWNVDKYVTVGAPWHIWHSDCNHTCYAY